MQLKQTSDEWERRQQFVERWQCFEGLQRREGEVAGKKEMQQPASANKEGKLRMSNNQDNIQQQQEQLLQ